METTPWDALIKKNKDPFSKALCCLQEIVDFVNLIKHVEHRTHKRLVLSLVIVDVGFDAVSRMAYFTNALIASSEIEHQHIWTRIDLILMEPLVPFIKEVNQRRPTNLELRRRADLHSVLQVVHENAVRTLGVYNCDHFCHFIFLLLETMAII